MLTCNQAVSKIKRYMKHPKTYFMNSPREVIIDDNGTGYVEYYTRYHIAQVDYITVDDPECVKIKLTEAGFISVLNGLGKSLNNQTLILIDFINNTVGVKIAYRSKIYKMKMYALKYSVDPKFKFEEKLKDVIKRYGFNELIIADKIRNITLKKQPRIRISLVLDVPYYNVIKNVSKVTGIDIKLVPLLITKLY